MAGLHGPLPTLRPWPRGQTRTARGRRGSLLLRRIGLSPTTPGRSPGALPNLVDQNLSRREGFGNFDRQGAGHAGYGFSLPGRVITHRLVPVRSRSLGGRIPATYWEREEF